LLDLELFVSLEEDDEEELLEVLEFEDELDERLFELDEVLPLLLLELLLFV
jgi:hypothetical protein